MTIADLCSCPEHRDGAPAVIRGHRYRLDDGEYPNKPDLRGALRWECSCGSRGRWQYQSDSVSYHGWLSHVERAT